MIGPDKAATTFFERPNLHISVGSPRYVLALKLLAARAEQDTSDITLLYGVCGYSTAADGISLLSELLPGRPVPAATVELLEAMFGPLAGVPEDLAFLAEAA